MSDKELIEAVCKFATEQIWAKTTNGAHGYESVKKEVAASAWLHEEAVKLIALVRENYAKRSLDESRPDYAAMEKENIRLQDMLAAMTRRAESTEEDYATIAVACQELEAEVLEEGKDAMADKFATIAAKTGKDGAK